MDNAEAPEASLFHGDMDLAGTLPDLLDPAFSLLVSDDGNDSHACAALADIMLPARKPETAVLPWFLEPSGWVHERALPQRQDDVSGASMQTYIDTIRRWLFEWVSGPSPLSSHAPPAPTDSPSANALIHPELYRHDMPRTIQDAYTAVATYQYRAPGASTETALRILEARTEQLVQEQALREAIGSSSEGSGGLSTLEHLARVHALLAYQALRLFDGDVHARAQADGLVGTLFAWCDAMWERARADTPTLAQQEFLRRRNNHEGGADDGDESTTPELWRSFVRVESVRRAFLTARILQNAYLMQKNGWSACPGGVALTLRRGVWSARSAYAWRKQSSCSPSPAAAAAAASRENSVRRRHPLLLGLLTTRLDSVLAEAAPADVDEFGLALMGVHFGEERLDRWMDEKGSADRQTERYGGLLGII